MKGAAAYSSPSLESKSLRVPHLFADGTDCGYDDVGQRIFESRSAGVGVLSSNVDERPIRDSRKYGEEVALFGARNRVEGEASDAVGFGSPDLYISGKVGWEVRGSVLDKFGLRTRTLSLMALGVSVRLIRLASLASLLLICTSTSDGVVVLRHTWCSWIISSLASPRGYLACGQWVSKPPPQRLDILALHVASLRLMTRAAAVGRETVTGSWKMGSPGAVKRV